MTDFWTIFARQHLVVDATWQRLGVGTSDDLSTITVTLGRGEYLTETLRIKGLTRALTSEDGARIREAIRDETEEEVGRISAPDSCPAEPDQSLEVEP